MAGAYKIGAVKPSYRTLARKARYPTVSNIWASETPNARASRNRFLKDAFRRAVSTPPRYVRCIWANSARRCWDSLHSPSGCQGGGGPLTREASWASAYTLDAGIIGVLRWLERTS